MREIDKIKLLTLSDIAFYITNSVIFFFKNCMTVTFLNFRRSVLFWTKTSNFISNYRSETETLVYLRHKWTQTTRNNGSKITLQKFFCIFPKFVLLDLSIFLFFLHSNKYSRKYLFYVHKTLVSYFIFSMIKLKLVE